MLRSTKSYYKLPTAHAQWFDAAPFKGPMTGPCAKWHGYDRSVHFEFSGTPDEHGWLVGFGDLKDVKKFLEYYFDHTALSPADDPRMEAILQAEEQGLVDLRILPYGVSMEMSALFVWEQVNPYINWLTKGRAYVSKVEIKEHDANSGILDVPANIGYAQGNKVAREYAAIGTVPAPVQKAKWDWVAPLDALKAHGFIV